jgi:hypothetical protein
MFNRCSRHLLHFVKDPRRFVFHAEAVRRASARQAKYCDKRADPWGKVWDDVWGIEPPIPRLVDNDAERIPGFPTQLPLALLLPIVGCASDPGDLVVDPFSGSATTGEACLTLGRRFVGIERNEEYVRLARQRLTAWKPPAWTSRQEQLRREMEAGRTVVVSMKDDRALIAWAEAQGLYQPVDRETPWGNPFRIPEDGDRGQVLQLYVENYLPYRARLLRDTATLKGMALGCHCAPLPCHADWLAAQANGEPWPALPPLPGKHFNGAAGAT